MGSAHSWAVLVCKALHSPFAHVPCSQGPEGLEPAGTCPRVQAGVFPLGAMGGVGFLCFSSKQRSQLCTWGAAKWRQLREPRMQQALLVPGRNSQGAVGWHGAAQTWRGAVWAWGSEFQWEQQLEGSRSFAKKNSGWELETGGTGGPLHLGCKDLVAVTAEPSAMHVVLGKPL